jgi:hypothetical protein
MQGMRHCHILALLYFGELVVVRLTIFSDDQALQKLVSPASSMLAKPELFVPRSRTMLASLLPFLLSQLVLAEPVAASIAVSGTSTAQPIGITAYVSLSIELVSFPLFAGMWCMVPPGERRGTSTNYM